jgi:hypothetical protein
MSNMAEETRFPKIHKIKCHPPYFQDMIDGKAKFDVRVNDRDYKKDDLLLEQEWDPETGQYTGRDRAFNVVHVLYGGVFGIPEDMCVMGISPMRDVGRDDVGKEMLVVLDDEYRDFDKTLQEIIIDTKASADTVRKISDLGWSLFNSQARLGAAIARAGTMEKIQTTYMIRCWELGMRDENMTESMKKISALADEAGNVEIKRIAERAIFGVPVTLDETEVDNDGKR